MSAERRGCWLDRGFLLALAVLLALGLAAIFDTREQVPLLPDVTISQAYGRYVGIGLMTCVLLPVYAIGVSGAMRRLGSPAGLTRRACRKAAVGDCAMALLLRSLAFQAVQMTFALAATLIKSGVEYTASDVAVFALQQLVLGTLWFAIVSLAMLAGRLVWGWGILAVLSGFLCAGYDILVAMLPLGSELTYAMGWQLVLSADPADVPASIAGAARLATIAILLFLLCRHLSRRADFLEGGAEDEAA